MPSSSSPTSSSAGTARSSSRHESELSWSTDVARHARVRRPPDAPGASTTRSCTGWFAEDFTLAELRTLRAVERMPGLRPLNTAYDGRFGILTLAEVVELARARSTPGRPDPRAGRAQAPGLVRAAPGLPMTELVGAELRRLEAAHADGPVSCSPSTPASCASCAPTSAPTGPQLVQLIEDEGAEGDRWSPRSGLREISTYAQAIAPSKRPHPVARRRRHARGRRLRLIDPGPPGGLAVSRWTLRAENAFLPSHLRRGSDPSGHGDALGRGPAAARTSASTA